MVLATYTTNGISGHPDHLVTHALVKRVFCELRYNREPYLRRLALFAIPDDVERPEHLRTTPRDEIVTVNLERIA